MRFFCIPCGKEIAPFDVARDAARRSTAFAFECHGSVRRFELTDSIAGEAVEQLEDFPVFRVEGGG